MEKTFDVGDEVYVYKDFWESLKEGKIIKGVIIHAEGYDYGYHGSGEWIIDYIVKGEDGEEYYANHGDGYKPFKFLDKEEIVELIMAAISEKKEYKNRVMQDLTDEAIGKYIREYIKTKKKNCSNLNKEINELTELLVQFSSETKGKEYKKVGR